MFSSRQINTFIVSLLGLVASVSATDHIQLNLSEGRRNLQDTCDKAAIRTVNNQFNSESTMGRSQSTGLGTCNGLSSEIGPGVWFAVQGTGSQIKATTCNAATEFKATILVYSGSTEDCNRNSLTCVAASDGTDFECSQAQTRSTSVEWRSLNGLTYYILVQPQIQGDGGTVWMKFRTVSTPQNDVCKKAIGPIPSVDLQIDGTTSDATRTMMEDYCGVNQLFPGVWYSFFGSGSEMLVSACSNQNANFGFSLYQGPNCDTLSCVLSRTTYSVTKVQGDQSKCLFQQEDESLAVRDLNEIRFQSVDQQRYYVYIAHDPDSVGSLTGDFRFFVKSLEPPPTFPPVETPTRTPSREPSVQPSPHGVTAFPTTEPTPIPAPTPTINPLQSQAPITRATSAGPNTRSILVCILFSLGALFMNDGL